MSGKMKFSGGIILISLAGGAFIVSRGAEGDRSSSGRAYQNTAPVRSTRTPQPGPIVFGDRTTNAQGAGLDEFLGIEGEVLSSSERSRLVLKKIASFETAAEFEKLLGLLPSNYCSRGGSHIIDAIWKEYPAEDDFGKFHDLLLLSSKWDQKDLPNHYVAEVLCSLLGSKVRQLDYPEFDLSQGKFLKTRKSINAFKMGFDRNLGSAISSGENSEKIAGFCLHLVNEGGEAFSSFGEPYSRALLGTHGVDDVIDEVVEKFEGKDKVQRSAFEGVLRSPDFEFEHAAKLVNSMSWGDKKVEDRFLSRAISTVAARSDSPTEDTFYFLESFERVEDQIAMGRIVGLILGGRLGNDFYDVIPQSLDPVVRKVMIDAYEGHR